MTRDDEHAHQVALFAWAESVRRQAENRTTKKGVVGPTHHNFKHGLSRTSEYQSWRNAIKRCHDPKAPRFAEWGGRGIEVCERWRDSFVVFVEDMGPKPGRGYSLDRIDNDGPYAPWNCRWATAQQQSANRPTWVNAIEFKGRTMTIAEWARELGISRESLRDRLSRGSVESALSMQKGERRGRAARQ